MKTNLLIFACLSTLAGCGASIDNSDDPELSGALDGKSDSAYSTSTYFTMRADLRKCAYPLCGGSFVARVNRATTKCVDGVYATECRVLDTDFSALGFTEVELGSFDRGTVVVRGTIKPTQVNGNTYGVLAVSEVWQPATTTAPAGTLYRVTAHHEAKLNSTISRSIGSVDLSGSDATDTQKSDAAATLAAGGTLLVAGDTIGKQLDGNQLYVRVQHVAQPACAAGEYLDVTGACGAANLPGTCKSVPQLCYQIYQPVCGCDGKTYSNDCVRLHAQVQLDHAGDCAGNTP